MILIIGGAEQGKLGFAKELYPQVTWIDGRTCKEEEVFSCQGIFHFHALIERMIRKEKDVSELSRRLIRENPDIRIISDEIGYGVVPADPFLRSYREMTGRICTELAAFSKEVYRVVCGIGTRIK